MSFNRVLLLILVAGLTFLVAMLALKPELLENVWLWLIGLSGTIIKLFQRVVDYFKGVGGKEEGSEEKPKPAPAPANSANAPKVPATQAPELPDAFNGTTITVLRFSDDGETTVGLLYVDDKFYCYTIEDTFREVKVPGKTRIAAGTYNLRINPDDTPLTLKYRNRYPEWFDHHIELMDVPEFSSIYIHNGGTHEHTEGCLLVSDSLTVTDSQATFTNSRETFKRFYQFITGLLNSGEAVRVRIHDEQGITQLN